MAKDKLKGGVDKDRLKAARKILDELFPDDDARMIRIAAGKGK